MKFEDLVSTIAKLEGKKHQASVGDVREVLQLVFDEAEKDGEGFCELLNRENKKRRAKK